MMTMTMSYESGVIVTGQYVTRFTSAGRNLQIRDGDMWPAVANQVRAYLIASGDAPFIEERVIEGLAALRTKAGELAVVYFSDPVRPGETDGEAITASFDNAAARVIEKAVGLGKGA